MICTFKGNHNLSTWTIQLSLLMEWLTTRPFNMKSIGIIWTENSATFTSSDGHFSDDSFRTSELLNELQPNQKFDGIFSCPAQFVIVSEEYYDCLFGIFNEFSEQTISNHKNIVLWLVFILWNYFKQAEKFFLNHLISRCANKHISWMMNIYSPEMFSPRITFSWLLLKQQTK